jgi:predicted transcriptional regulator
LTELGAMSVITAYLTPRLFDIWALRRDGFGQSEIAVKLGISRQAVNQALVEATAKVTKALTEAATINKIAIESLNSLDGILIGWSREFALKAVISVTRRDGLQVWYEHVADCSHCTNYDACRAYLFRSAKERQIRLTKEQRSLAPSKLAQHLFGMK